MKRLREKKISLRLPNGEMVKLTVCEQYRLFLKLWSRFKAWRMLPSPELNGYLRVRYPKGKIKEYDYPL